MTQCIISRDGHKRKDKKKYPGYYNILISLANNSFLCKRKLSFGLIVVSLTGKKRKNPFMASVTSSASAMARWKKMRPVNLFNWGKDNRRVEEKKQFKYHEIKLPFSLSLVSDTHLRGRELKCCYRASIDGFGANDFHRCSDFKGPCVIIGYTENNFKFGAFNPEGYRSTDDYYDTFNAFLFYWKEPNIGGAENYEDPVVLPKVGGSGAALFDYARGGPQFGADGLLIGPPLTPVMGVFTGPDASTGIGDLRQAKSRLGLSYAKRHDGKESLFGDDSRAALVEVQVFCSPKIASLY